MKKILIVENDLVLQKLYKTILKKDYEVTCVSTVVDAMDLLAKNSYDIHIFDLMLGSKSTLDGTELIKLDLPNKFLITALDLNKEKYVDAVYLRKPFRVETLKELLSKVI